MCQHARSTLTFAKKCYHLPTVTEQTSFFWEKSTTTQGLCLLHTATLTVANTSMYFTIYLQRRTCFFVSEALRVSCLFWGRNQILDLSPVFASDDNVWFISYLLIQKLAIITSGLLYEPLNGSQSLSSEEVLLPECSLDRHCDGFFCSSQMLLSTKSIWGVQNKPLVWLVNDLKIMEQIKSKT